MTGTGLLVIGDVVTDVVALHDGPALTGLAVGTDTAADIVLRPGGSGANTASWAARLGADARILTRVGFDTGEWHAAELRRFGVRPHLRIDPNRPTAVVIAMVDGSGERSMLTNRGAGGHIGIDDWDESLLDGVGHLHLSGYTLFAEPGLQLARLALAEASRRGVSISVDPSSTGFLRSFGPQRFVRETLAARLIIPNLDEALLLTGETTAEGAAEELSLRYGAAAVKLGARGALMARNGKLSARVSGLAAEVIDSIGAGDAFAAGLLTALLNGADDGAALDAGRRAGAEAVSVVGGRPRILPSDMSPNRLYPLSTN
ncbi:sugar/nucleoside kinase (ribokinase family) [Streptosporangium becharense]|uniref:Sugar/nucleoside kinase (Ribokinase family) n=1 Tax=Streptosporangium becharense TaxID=1816182 RepID=A0A7W9IKY0_9ACTN|nr:sugar kinase [Streptosporangium becharense]MBB2911533.1 sugar/nucleoside kinase (ribokinase family) [Streptosporangium becharense]MBB5822649.1 sugar/nucleoside kinase (ribokinase family) [Streptosporangium becharense]